MFKTKNILILSLIALTSCAKLEAVSSGIVETGNETAQQVDEVVSSGKAVQLAQDMNVRYLKNGILELKTDIPYGTKLEIPEEAETVHYDFRNDTGGLSRSSTGFIAQVKIVSVPKESVSRFTVQKIKELNNTSGGLFISASIVGSVPVVAGESYAAIQASLPGAGFNQYYSSIGKPKFTFTKSVATRFGERLNKPPTRMIAADESLKWQKIYSEIKKAVDRTVSTKKAYMVIDKDKAVQASIDFENKGVISTTGAWSVAVLGTATRHGFANVPCAETQSEILRQAYKRAGYKVTDDFNKSRGNELIWSAGTASVKGFSMSLYKAGFIPWDASKYRPPVGAFLMHGSGMSPGHTYIAAGDDGQIIVDNGAPQGRDLRKTSAKSIDLQYLTGVFFLPPGITPKSW